MRKKTIRRLVTGVSAGALAASCTATLGAGGAGADPVSASGTVTTYNYNVGIHNQVNVDYLRTVSNAAPAFGDVITITDRITGVKAAGTGFETYAQNLEDHHPECLQLVPDSPTVAAWRVGSGYATSDSDSVSTDAGAVKASNAGWALQVAAANGGSTYVELTSQFTVTCAPGPLATGGLRFHTTPGKGNWQPGGGWFDRTSAGPTINVQKAASSTTLAPIGSARVGDATQLTATVTGGTTGDTVEFYSGATKIGTDTLDTDGTASVEWTPSIKGTQSITAEYLGNTNVAASTSPAQTVQVAEANVASTTTLTVPATGQVGTAVTLHAAVSPTGSGGTVTFHNGAATIAGVPVAADGTAEYSWTPTAAGNASITATFSGRSGVTGSTSSRAAIEIAEAPATVQDSHTTIDDVTGAAVGTPTMLRATVTVDGAPAASGTVTFKDGDTVIGTATVSGGTATFQWTPTVAGQRTVTAEFASGTADVASSNDRTSVIVGEADPGEGTDPGTDPGDGDASGSLDLASLFGSLGS